MREMLIIYLVNLHSFSNDVKNTVFLIADHFMYKINYLLNHPSSVSGHL